jgi:hypothetical protein
MSRKCQCRPCIGDELLKQQQEAAAAAAAAHQRIKRSAALKKDAYTKQNKRCCNILNHVQL